MEMNSALAQQCLDKQKIEVHGWCRKCTLKPTKEGGYIQVSFRGENKFATLEEVVMWAGGFQKSRPDHQCSHLCAEPACATCGHVISETAVENGLRKNCVVWVDCPHPLPSGAPCPLKISVCQHFPKCIKYCAGYSSQEDFLARGVH